MFLRSVLLPEIAKINGTKYCELFYKFGWRSVLAFPTLQLNETSSVWFSVCQSAPWIHANYNGRIYICVVVAEFYYLVRLVPPGFVYTSLVMCMLLEWMLQISYAYLLILISRKSDYMLFSSGGNT